MNFLYTIWYIQVHLAFIHLANSQLLLLLREIFFQMIWVLKFNFNSMALLHEFLWSSISFDPFINSHCSSFAIRVNLMQELQLPLYFQTLPFQKIYPHLHCNIIALHLITDCYAHEHFYSMKYLLNIVLWISKYSRIS